jgi:preprotein translocase subunit SecD
MFENLNARLAVVGFVFLVSFAWTLPNFTNTSGFWWPSQDKLAYGLDIQGGLHLVLGIDVDSAVEGRINKLSYEMKKQLLDEKKVNLDGVTLVDAQTARIRMTFDPSDKNAVVEYMEDTSFGQGNTFQILEAGNDFIEARFYEAQMRVFKKSLVDRTIETIRNRIDEFGVKEPTIAAQSDSRILVQLPGVQDSTQAKELINKTAKLEFMIWDPDFVYDYSDPNRKLGTPQYQELLGWVADAEAQGNFALGQDDLRYSEYIKKMDEALKDKLPKNRVVRFEKLPNAKTLEAGKAPIVLQTDAMMSGETLNDAYVGFDQIGKPNVIFTFDAKGAKEFGDLTTTHVKKQMAIVLDGVVQSAPNLREPITGGRGSIDMGGSDRQKVMDEATLTAMVLRSGALPAELEQLEERTVGPTLGKDSIEKGKFAGLIGGLLVFIFMIIYYKSYGVLADLALAFNIMMILAILTSLQATLTLPGVAGIVLTIGMAVDANVIIFERIKEEVAKGAGLLGAIKEGYARAFTAILDANVTTAAVCVVLMYFGTGPIRGFAVTLIVGIITSMFTAIFFTRTILNLLVGKLKMNIAP